MKVLVTGANGFLGTRIVDAARAQGLDVRASVRPAADVSHLRWDGVEVVRGDLRSRADALALVEGCDAVIHSAAALAGGLHERLLGTVVTTENLLAAMEETAVDRLVLVSSYSVYDYDRMMPFAVLDEDSPIRDVANSLDSYAQAKIVQERVVRDAETRGLRATIVRPGVLYGPGNSWSARLGMRLSERLWVRVGAFAALPLIYVDNCAEALVACVLSDRSIGRTYNVLDAESFTQRAYTARLAEHQPVRPRVIPVPWLVVRGAAEAGRLVSRAFFGGRAKIPQMFTIEGVNARGLPLRHRADRIREDTGWVPRYNLDEALRRTVAAEHPTSD